MGLNLNDIEYFALNLSDLTILSPAELLLVQEYRWYYNSSKVYYYKRL